MFNTILFSKNKKLKRFVDEIYKDDKRYRYLIKALKNLGDFDSKIEINEVDDSIFLFDKEVYAIDKKGVKFSFYVKSRLLERQHYLKKSLGDYYEIYNNRGGVDTSGYLCKNGYTLESFSWIGGHPKKFKLEKDDITYFVSMPGDTCFDLKMLKLGLEKMENISFRDFYTFIIHEMIDIEKLNFLSFWANKNEQIIGSVYFQNGELSKFYMVKNKGNEFIELSLEDSIWKENIYSKIDYTRVSDVSLKGEIESARGFVKEHTKKDHSV